MPGLTETLAVRWTLWQEGWTPGAFERPARPPESVLVVRRDRLGDVLLVTPLLRALKRQGVGWVGVLTSEAGVRALEANPDADEVRAESMGAGAFRAWCRERRPEAAVDPFIPFSLASARWCRMSGAPVRLGYASPHAAGFFTGVVPASAGTYEAAQHLRFLDAWWNGAAPAREVALVVGRTGASKAKAEAIWTCAGWEGRRPVAVLNPGARRAPHRWGEANYGALGAALRAKHGMGILVTWGPGERALAEATARGAGGVMAPETSVPDLAAICERSALVVCGDTGPFHVAVASAPRIAAVFGGSDVSRWAPPGQRGLKTLAGKRTREITVEEVLAACEGLLENPEGGNFSSSAGSTSPR